MSELEKSLEMKLAEVKDHFDDLKTHVDHLPQAIKLDVEERMHGVEIMIRAFDRDVKENELKKPNHPARVAQLAKVLTARIDHLEHDVEFLALGNTSTLVVAGDKAMETFSKIAKKFGRALSELRDYLHLQ